MLSDTAWDRITGATPAGRARRSSRWLACAALLLGGHLAASTAARAQDAAPSADTLAERAADRVAADVCDRRVVLLGELPEHGEARGFAVKARVVERLVTRCGFRAVL